MLFKTTFYSFAECQNVFRSHQNDAPTSLSGAKHSPPLISMIVQVATEGNPGSISKVKDQSL